MAKPATIYPWAISSENYNITIGTTVYNVGNLAAPVVGDSNHDFTVNGVLKTTGLPVQYYNYQLSGFSEWFQYISDWYIVGDVIKTTNNYVGTEVNDQFGGTWSNIGNEVLAGPETVYYWKKTA